MDFSDLPAPPDMPIAHDALVLVGDGEKALFLRNQGTPMHVKLIVERVFGHDNPSTHEQGTDRPGRTHSRMTVRRSAMEETDWHQLGEERFTSEIAAALYRLAHANRFSSLIVVAPPRVLGALRKALHAQVIARIAAEVPKELTSHTVGDIERILTD